MPKVSVQIVWTVLYGFRKSDVKTQEVRRIALELYLEGMGFRAIGRVLKISYGTVYQWVKKWGNQVLLPQNDDPVAVMELDEMHTYVGSKKTTVGYGLLLIDLQDGSSHLCVDQGGKETCMKLYESLKQKDVPFYCTDHWKCYEECLENEFHIQSKAETFTVEGYNIRIRHYIARLKRKSKCYSKSVEMIRISLNLLMLKLNNEFYILI